MPVYRLEERTGNDVGFSGEKQIDICLRKIVELGGTAKMKDLYAAMEAELNPRGFTLSFQGKSSLRFFVNEIAVREGYIYPHDKRRPGWHITPEGRARVRSLSGLSDITGDITKQADTTLVVEPIDYSSQEPDELVDVSLEELVEPEVAETVADDVPEPVAIDGLLEYVDQVLGCLPVIAAENLPDPDTTTVVREGSPGDVQGIVRALMQFAHPGEVSLQLTLNSDGWRVVMDIHPRQEHEGG